MNREEYQAKHKEPVELAQSIEVWKSAPAKKSDQDKVNRLWERLEMETYNLEAKFLEVKLAIFKEILAIMKK